MANTNDRMGDIGGDLIILGVLVIGGIVVYNKFFGPSAADKAKAANNATTNANTPAANQNALDKVTASGQQPTIDTSTMNSMANSIATLMNTVDASNLPDAGVGSQLLEICIQINNSADWYTLVNVFGTRTLSDGTSVDLVTALQRVMEGYQISNLDSYFSDQGITIPGTTQSLII